MSNEVTTATTEMEQVDKTGEVYNESASLSNLSPAEFPLISSLNVHTEKHMGKLLQEIVKLSGKL